MSRDRHLKSGANSRHPRPSVDALVEACMRVNTSGMRRRPTAASSANADPASQRIAVAVRQCWPLDEPDEGDDRPVPSCERNGQHPRSIRKPADEPDRRNGQKEGRQNKKGRSLEGCYRVVVHLASGLLRGEELLECLSRFTGSVKPRLVVFRHVVDRHKHAQNGQSS